MYEKKRQEKVKINIARLVLSARACFDKLMHKDLTNKTKTNKMVIVALH